MSNMVEVSDVVGLEMLEDETVSIHVRAPGGTVYVVLSNDDFWRLTLLGMALMAHVAGIEAYPMDDGATWFRAEPLSESLPHDSVPWARK